MTGTPNTMRAVAACLLAAGLTCASCSQPQDHPPLAGDAAEPAPDTDSAELIEETGGSSPCGETAIELPIKRPNFYFLLDTSESMVDTMPDSGGMTRHRAARTAISDMLLKVGHRVNFGAAVFPAPQSEDACAAGTEVFELRPGDRRPEDPAAVGPQLDALLFTLRKLTPTGATPVTATLQELLPALSELQSRTFLFLLTDGAPNCDTSESCDPERCIANIEAFTFEDGTACDDELNCCQAALFPHLCLDEDDASREVQKLRTNGVRTYIVGFPGSEVYADVLDEMARAAGTAQTDAGTAYYRVDDVEQLATTLTTLGQELSLDCHLELEEAPERAALVRVFANDVELEAEDADGWEWTTETSITLLGEACESWKHGEWDRIDILEGCEARVR